MTKFKTLLFLLLAGSFFAACSSDDDNSPSNPSDEIGFSGQAVTGSAEFSVRNRHTSVVFDDKMWVIGGNHSIEKNRWDGKNNEVWSSSDGMTWTEATDAAPFSARIGHVSVVFDNKLWVIGGDDEVITDEWWQTNLKNDVWYSSDGMSWTEATNAAQFSTRIDPTSVVFDGKIWIIGGYEGDATYKNDVWYSSDGITWTQATSSAPFSPRNRHTSVVFDDKIWVIGGYASEYEYEGEDQNDVWYSSDGITWTEATDAAPFSAREGHSSVVFDDKMWVIGGNDGEDKNDAWYSSDGVNWTEATAAAPFSKRYNHTSVIFDDKMWVIAGYGGEDKNDVWAFGTDQ